MSDKYTLKRGIFNIYELTRELWNDYYNGKDDYSKEDLERVETLLIKLIEDASVAVSDVGDMISYE